VWAAAIWVEAEDVVWLAKEKQVKAGRSIDLPQYGLDALARERLTPALPGRSTAVNTSPPCPTGHSTN